MHIESLNEMNRNLRRCIVGNQQYILDVGSMEIKRRGSYRELMLPAWRYVGLDTTYGPNVDVVAPYGFPFPDGTFDVVISGQCFEHCTNPFVLMREIARVLKQDGRFLGVAPFKWEEHRHPIDCWRILPDGWRALFYDSGLTTLEAYIVQHEADNHADCWGIAEK